MRTLAIAKPNMAYQWVNNFDNVEIHACLVNNSVRFFEIRLTKQIEISEETAKSLFQPAYPLRDQPFIVGDNLPFYIVANKERKRFTERYYKLKNKNK